MLATAETIVAEINPLIQQEMTDALNYVDSCNPAEKDPWNIIETPEVSGMETEEIIYVENRTQVLTKTNVIETLGEGLKLLEEANQSAPFPKIDERFLNPSCQPQSSTPGSQKRFSVVDYSSYAIVASGNDANLQFIR